MSPKMRAATVFAAMAMALVPAVGSAQAPGPATSASPPAAATSAAVPAGSAPASPADSASAAPAKPVVPATGYGWSTPKRPQGVRGTHARARSGPPTPGAILPGFETLADGSTRLFVQLSQAVPYDTKASRGTITYVLKGAHVEKRNNYNPLVTVHFNTPVTQARLVPHGKDLWFVVDLRANVQPTVAMDTTKEGGAMLRIEFPKGDYLPGGAAAPPAAPPPAAGSSSSAPAPPSL